MLRVAQHQQLVIKRLEKVGNQGCSQIGAVSNLRFVLMSEQLTFSFRFQEIKWQAANSNLNNIEFTVYTLLFTVHLNSRQKAVFPYHLHTHNTQQN